MTFHRTNTKHETLQRNSGHRGGTGGAAQTALTVPGITTRVAATGFILSVPTTVGMNCLIEFTDSLTAAGWTKLAEVNGDGTIQTLLDSAASPARFYRVRPLP